MDHKTHTASTCPEAFPTALDTGAMCREKARKWVGCKDSMGKVREEREGMGDTHTEGVWERHTGYTVVCLPKVTHNIYVL